MMAIAFPRFARHRFKVQWFDCWKEELDKALYALPEMEGCPHKLYRLLLQNRVQGRKRIALVSELGTPVALAGLKYRARTRDWVPVTHYLLPAAVFPVREGSLIPVLEAFGLDIWISWWGFEGTPPGDRLRELERTPTYKLALAGNFEQFWRGANDQMKDVRRARNKCKGFRLEVNLQGSTEWTLQNWHKKWHGGDSPCDSNLDDRLLVARYLEDQGRYYTLTLLDGEIVTAGISLVSHRKEVIGLYSYRKPEYDRNWVGQRLLDLSFHWAAESGFEKLDLGGDYADHKARWAPEDGEKYALRVCPSRIFIAKDIATRIRSIGQSIMGGKS